MQLGEVPVERPQLAALDVEVPITAKYDCPKTVPFGLIAVRADRQLVAELGQHRRDRRHHAET